MSASRTPFFYPKVLRLYLELGQYPILAPRIRERMREEIFSRGVISPTVFESEVREKAIQSQELEGVEGTEPPTVWEERLSIVRDNLTDFYFAYNLPHAIFEDLVQEALAPRRHDQPVVMSFNPELAPWEVLFARGHEYESYPPERSAEVWHHLHEIRVVLIKALISDQLEFVGLAKDVFTIADLDEIRHRRIGRGKIGGKAAGMLLAWKMIQRFAGEAGYDIAEHIGLPESYFIGADVHYDYNAVNHFFDLMNLKYKSREEIIEDYPRVREAMLAGHLPGDILGQLRELLDDIGDTPLIVRSSSLLEDNFQMSFAGKYDSFFLPNQGTLNENLHAAERAIIAIYASVVNPDALIYRQHMGLTDYDERMAVLLQKVEGQRHGKYYFPALAGVGFSYNPFRWTSRIEREAGLTRLVCGLGTRAVDRVGQDYPRMIGLSHPHLRPEKGAEETRRYSQRLIDVINLEENTFETVPVTEVLDEHFPALRMVASLNKGDYLERFTHRPSSLDPGQLVLTFEGLTMDGTFTSLLENMMRFLRERYRYEVDVEFTGEVLSTYPQPEFRLTLLQCRPLSKSDAGNLRPVPTDVPEDDQLFTANRQVPDGVVERVRYVVYVDPAAYARLDSPPERLEIARLVGRLNRELEGENFILMGPGRWGSSNINLGVKVSYADIFNAKALLELASSSGLSTPELSYGTHFFQDLVEANILPLALYPDKSDTLYRQEFFRDTPNLLPDFLPEDADYASHVRVIDVPAIADGRLLEIVMNGEEDRALGYLRHYEDSENGS